MSKTIAISKPTTRGNYLKKKSPPPPPSRLFKFDLHLKSGGRTVM